MTVEYFALYLMGLSVSLSILEHALAVIAGAPKTR